MCTPVDPLVSVQLCFTDVSLFVYFMLKFLMLSIQNVYVLHLISFLLRIFLRTSAVFDH